MTDLCRGVAGFIPFSDAVRCEQEREGKQSESNDRGSTTTTTTTTRRQLCSRLLLGLVSLRVLNAAWRSPVSRRRVQAESFKPCALVIEHPASVRPGQDRRRLFSLLCRALDLQRRVSPDSHHPSFGFYSCTNHLDQSTSILWSARTSSRFRAAHRGVSASRKPLLKRAIEVRDFDVRERETRYSSRITIHGQRILHTLAPFMRLWRLALLRKAYAPFVWQKKKSTQTRGRFGKSKSIVLLFPIGLWCQQQGHDSFLDFVRAHESPLVVPGPRKERFQSTTKISVLSNCA